MYNPRNPFTPRHGETFTPNQYLERYLKFHLWLVDNPVTHLPGCGQEDHNQVRYSGMCCLAALKQCIDHRLLEIAGCRSGIWVEPEGFQNKLAYCWKRLQELEEGHDYFWLWNQTLEERDEELSGWIRKVRQQDIPGFSQRSFKTACKNHGYQPDLVEVAKIFYEDVAGMRKYWEK